MVSYRCPSCGAEVPMNNINVEKDLMLCASCGVASAFSAVAGVSGAGDDYSAKLSAEPPKHLTVTTDIDPNDVSEIITLTYRRIASDAIVLLIFSCIWIGFSLSGIYGRQIITHQFDWKVSLFGLPFVIGSLFLIGSCLYNFFGKKVLKLKRGNGVYFSGVGPFGRKVRFTYNRATKIACGNIAYYVSPRGRRNMLRLELTNPGNAEVTKICMGMEEDELEYTAAILQRECKRV